MSDKEQARKDYQKKQEQITAQWKAFSAGPGKQALEDLFQYIDSMREMYRKYAEERQMPHPNGDGQVPIDNETVAALLQNSRGLNIVKTYISNRIDTDVAQSDKN